MRKKEKGKSGAVTNFISRTQAIKKLRINLVDFRRLCILKGIFPREPKSIKKISKGSSAPKTFYWTKDIQYLAHDPLLKKFREFKVFVKRLRKAMGKGEKSMADHLKKNKPVYTLDHLIRERFPTFIDALRDLDDALCMSFLFAKMPSSKLIETKIIENCNRFCAEFMNYCIITNSLRKVFLSIKGIYYQAEIQGQPITWIVPYQFTPRNPKDVDFRVMLIFLEFYETLLGFVNYKLYRDENLHYPPILNQALDAEAAGLSAYQIVSLDQNETSALIKSVNPDDDKATAQQKAESEDSRKRVATLRSKLAYLEKGSKEDEGEVQSTDTTVQLDEFPENKSILESSNEVALRDLKENEKQLQVFKKLFSNCVFYLSREVPKESLEFVIRCFGGKVGWEDGDGSPYQEEDEVITHHVMDRPSLKHRFIGRNYVQPQWIYDCINFRKLFPTSNYAPGVELPPHFSPFVEEQEGDYVPKELLEMRGEISAASIAKPPKRKEIAPKEQEEEEQEEEDEEEVIDDGDGEEETEELEDALKDDEEDEDDDEEDEDEDDEEGEELPDSDDEEAIYQKELEAEAAGIPFSEFTKKMAKAKTQPKAKEIRKKEEEKESKELAKMMMKKKDRRLYEKIKKGQNKKKHYVERMEKKRKEIDDSKDQGKKKKPRVK